jgi:hypothetical protein
MFAHPTTSREAMTGFASAVRHIHPFLPPDEDDPTELRLLRLSFLERVPCPPPPLYGRELQARQPREQK